MATAMVGAVILNVAGEEYVFSARIVAIIWEGATTSGDTVSIRSRGPISSTELWAGRTDTTQTYLGANFGPYGINCPDGFVLTQISSGRLFVYLLQE